MKRINLPQKYERYQNVNLATQFRLMVKIAQFCAVKIKIIRPITFRL